MVHHAVFLNRFPQELLTELAYRLRQFRASEARISRTLAKHPRLSVTDILTGTDVRHIMLLIPRLTGFDLWPGRLSPHRIQWSKYTMIQLTCAPNTTIAQRWLTFYTRDFHYITDCEVLLPYNACGAQSLGFHTNSNYTRSLNQTPRKMLSPIAQQ